MKRQGRFTKSEILEAEERFSTGQSLYKIGREMKPMHTIRKIAVVFAVMFGISACNTAIDSSNLTVVSPIVSEQKLPKDWFTETPLNEKKDIYRGFNQFHKLVHCNFKECRDGYTPAEFITESNGNKFLALSARYGQLSKEFGDEDREFRNELQIAIADNKKFSFEGVELWYGFRVKKPEKVDIQGRNILGQTHNFINDTTFTQIKHAMEFRRGSNIKTCARGVVFYMNTDGWVRKGNGRQYHGRQFIKDIITTDWTTYKIGIKFSRTSNGWIKVYKNDDLVWDDNGPNMITEFYPECNGKSVQEYGGALRIGLYAKSSFEEAVSTLHFDDFVSGDSEEKVDLFHLKN